MHSQCLPKTVVHLQREQGVLVGRTIDLETQLHLRSEDAVLNLEHVRQRAGVGLFPVSLLRGAGPAPPLSRRCALAPAAPPSLLPRL